MRTKVETRRYVQQQVRSCHGSNLTTPLGARARAVNLKTEQVSKVSNTLSPANTNNGNNIDNNDIDTNGISSNKDNKENNNDINNGRSKDNTNENKNSNKDSNNDNKKPNIFL